MDKLVNFPTVYSPTINRNDRREFMINQSKKYNINIKLFNTEYFILNREKYNIIGKYAGSNKQEDLKSNFYTWMTYATFIGYLQCMQDWFYNSKEKYLIVCDDDTDFSSIDYWNFTWNELLNLTPPKFQCLQLIRMRGDIHSKLSITPVDEIINQQLSIIDKLNQDKLDHDTIHFKIVERNMFHFNVGGGAFLLKREYVEKLLEHHVKENAYMIDIKTPDQFYHLIKDEITPPHLEASIVSLAKKEESFNFPLFTENCELYTYFQNPNIKQLVKSVQWEYNKQNNSIFYNIFWKHVSMFTTLEKMMCNTGLNYDVISPSKMWTRFADPVKQEFMRSFIMKQKHIN